MFLFTKPREKKMAFDFAKQYAETGQFLIF